MTRSYFFYLKNIFVNPMKAARAIREEPRLGRVAGWSYLIGIAAYMMIVLLAYKALGWGSFPYHRYYPHYFSPFWWEVFVVPVWGAVIAFAFGVPCYYLSRLFGGTGSFKQVLAFVLLASVVSLPVFLLVDLYTVVFIPDWVIRFAETGSNFLPFAQVSNKLVWFVETFYSYLAMSWQGVVTIAGLSAIHRIKWYRNLAGLVAGFIVFMTFLMSIRDYVATII